jgi:hypothetical protein
VPHQAAVDVALAQLRCPSLSAPTLRSCLSALEPLMRDDERCWTYAVRVGVYDAVVAGMRAHAADAVVQWKTCRWLERVSTFVVTSSEESASGGGATTAEDAASSREKKRLAVGLTAVAVTLDNDRW